MAEYIWIDGQNGVRSKTKVRVLLLGPHVQPQCRLPAIFGAGEAIEALLSGKPGDTVSLGKRLDISTQRNPNSRKCLVLMLILSLSTDSRQTVQRRQGPVRMELRRFILRPSPRRQFRRLSPARSYLPRSVPSWRQHPRIVRVLGSRWDTQQVQLPS